MFQTLSSLAEMLAVSGYDGRPSLHDDSELIHTNSLTHNG